MGGISMKKGFILLIAIVSLLGCQHSKKHSIVLDEPLIFDEKVSINVKEMNFVPHDVFSLVHMLRPNNFELQSKIDQYKKEINKWEFDTFFHPVNNFLVLEIVFDVTQTIEKTIYIQDYFNFETVADVKFEGVIYEDKWINGRLWLDNTYKTFLDKGQTKKMRMYLCIPEEMILDNEIFLKENNSNQLFYINTENITNNGWKELKIGESIESDNYSMTINRIIENESEIDTELEAHFDVQFYGLNVTIENKTSKTLYTGNCIQNTYMYENLYDVMSADQYRVLNMNDVLREEDVTREFTRIGPYEKITLDYGFTWKTKPTRFLLFQNGQFYFLENNSKDVLISNP